MGYTVTPEGNIICSTPEEALALQKAIGNESGRVSQVSQGNASAEVGSRWTESRFKHFVKLIKRNQKEFLEILLKHPDGQTDRGLRQALHMDSNLALAGVVTGLVKNARKAGVGSSDLFTREPVQIGDQKSFEYKVTESFRRMAEKAGGLS